MFSLLIGHDWCGKRFCIKLIIACLVQRIEGTEKMHLINFKDLTGQDLNALVDLGIEVKLNPKKYLKSRYGMMELLYNSYSAPPLANLYSNLIP